MFNIKLKEGYFNSDFNITLAIMPEDRKSFTELLIMLNLAKELNQTVDNINIADLYNNVITLPVLNFKILMLQYGVYYQTLWEQYSTYKKTITNCNTNDELQNITIVF